MKKANLLLLLTLLVVPPAFSETFKEVRNENLLNHVDFLVSSCESDTPNDDCYTGSRSFILSSANSEESASVLKGIDTGKFPGVSVQECFRKENKCLISVKMEKSKAPEGELEATLEEKKRVAKINAKALEVLKSAFKYGTAVSALCNKDCATRYFENHVGPRAAKEATYESCDLAFTKAEIELKNTPAGGAEVSSVQFPGYGGTNSAKCSVRVEPQANKLTLKNSKLWTFKAGTRTQQELSYSFVNKENPNQKMTVGCKPGSAEFSMNKALTDAHLDDLGLSLKCRPLSLALEPKKKPVTTTDEKVAPK